MLLSVLGRGEATDLAPFRQHVTAMTDELAHLVTGAALRPRRFGGDRALLAYRGDSDTYDDLQNADLVRVIERRKGLPVAFVDPLSARRPRPGMAAEGLAFPGIS